MDLGKHKSDKVRNWRMFVYWMLFWNTEVFLSALILTLAMGTTITDFGKIWLSISLNIFAIPILIFGFNFVWWVNFAIVVSWLGYWGMRGMVKHLWEGEF